eukprot:1298020-Alexandrium_andersonii.AAC.1
MLPPRCSAPSALCSPGSSGLLEISGRCALFRFRLAPLATRRDIALLGLVHRTVLGQGPPR